MSFPFYHFNNKTGQSLCAIALLLLTYFIWFYCLLFTATATPNQARQYERMKELGVAVRFRKKCRGHPKSRIGTNKKQKNNNSKNRTTTLVECGATEHYNYFSDHNKRQQARNILNREDTRSPWL